MQVLNKQQRSWTRKKALDCEEKAIGDMQNKEEMATRLRILASKRAALASDRVFLAKQLRNDDHTASLDKTERPTM